MRRRSDPAAPRATLAAGKARLVPWVVMLLAALAMAPALLWGFDVCDSGFYMTFYDNVFRHPQAVEYNFMYYGSGLAGGAVAALTGGSLMAMRFFGLAVNLVTLWMVLRWLGPRLRLWPAALGAVAVGIAMWGVPAAFYNDTMTVCLAVGSLWCLSRACTPGTRSPRGALAFGAGLLAGINGLVRLPNVLEFLFILLIPGLGLRGADARRTAGLFAVGWLSGLLTVVMLAACFGHLPQLAAVCSDLLGAASSSGAESTHSLKSLVAVQVFLWIRIIAVAAVIFGILWVMRRGWFSTSAARVGAGVLIALAVIGGCLTFDATLVMAGMAVAVAVGVLVWGKEAASKRMAWSVLLLLIILPLGSDNGILNFGALILWLPVLFFFTALWRNRAWRPGLVLTGTFLILYSGGQALTSGFYFDDTPPAAATARVAGTGGVRTSTPKAARIEAIMTELKPFLSHGDTLMVYGSAPMLNHLTKTLPAIGCSWPELLTPTQLQSRLEASPPPAVLMMRFNTLGPVWSDPSEEYLQGVANSNTYHNTQKSRIVLDFLNSRHYRLEAASADWLLYRLPDS